MKKTCKMRRVLHYLFLLCVLFSGNLIAQNTYYGDLKIVHQSQIDNFNYTDITGRLDIDGKYIANLDGLEILNFVGISLSI